ncbi:UDP-N-acetylmuramoyl-tripeptide--D-alanyl-D-alanine ligase [Bacillus oleivorans]|uniref:UDP-N-acetylmuramoyl-tripeptide--D-alanyl-D-alanine ligase n=1 Tax=Bacillus oleivorans TaxID=1448271 RepID=A0A285D432_9BACI|nr:UDP-N-acetylmuramoyl-tripeptide--D-alanyl-D-alanine ligase [Bacillus oleivorans]SNX74577.1 UDP-N-acetylmuramoyl-tripeptide--D-alanyl-D-alanine ligase [Bacillus oleivorans]
MITKTLEQVAAITNAKLSIPERGQEYIQGVSINTRSIEKGQLFVPLAGEKTDGHQFVEQAFEKGASAAFWKRDLPNPPSGFPLLFVDDPLEALQMMAKAYRDSLKVKVVGVTGSNGKTTTKDMIAKILSGTYSVQKTIGNYNNHIGLPLTLLSLREDTEVIVLEMGMSARGEIQFLSKLARPDVAVITNIGEAHLEDLGSREGIAEAKFEIIAGLNANGLFVYDGDEPLLQAKVQSRSGEFQVISFGKSDNCDYYPMSVEAKGEGTEFIVQALPRTKMFLPVLGLHNVKNALAAIAVARFLQVDEENIKNQLESLSLSAMRMESHKGYNGALVINDAYNASPTSMKAAIELVQSLENYPKKVLVLGDMLELGPKEKEFHKEIGHFISADHIQYVYTYGPLARFIAKGIREKGKPIEVKEFSSKDELRNEVKGRLDEQTVLLVKGSRGMKLEEVLEGLIQ